MGDSHSSAGDENGVIYGAIYGAFIQAKLNAFKSTVEKWTPETGELGCKGGSNNATLGSGRPLLNIRVTAGQALHRASRTVRDRPAQRTSPIAL